MLTVSSLVQQLQQALAYYPEVGELPISFNSGEGLTALNHIVLYASQGKICNVTVQRESPNVGETRCLMQ